MDAYAYAPELNVLDTDFAALGSELSSVCNKVGGILRKDRLGNTQSIDMSAIFYYSCDLSDADLSRSKLESSTFQDTDFAGVTLKESVAMMVLTSTT